LKIRSIESTYAVGGKRPLHVGVRVLRLWLLLCPWSREAAGKGGRRRLRSRCRGGARGRRWVARKERNLYDPGVVHDGGVPHSSSDDRVVRALVLPKPSGKALLPRGRCEQHDISQHVVLRIKLETHVIMKSHMNVICLQYRSLLCVGGLVSAHRVRHVWQDPVVVRDRWRWRGSRHVRHPCPHPREVPLKVERTLMSPRGGGGGE
jgi:hypothetical protein